MNREERKRITFKIVQRAKKRGEYERLPKKLSDIKESYKVMIKELGKR